MADIFDSLQGIDKGKGDIFDSISQPSQGKLKSAARTALQIPQGIAEATGPGIAAGFWHLLGQGEALDPEEIERLKEISRREGIPFNEEAYMEAAHQALGAVPTVGNIASKIEEKTGLPLEPRTWYEKALRLGSMAGKFQPGSAGQKATAAIATPTIKAGLEYAGVPEPFAELGGLALGAKAGTKGPEVNIGKETKPSGLTTRRYEKLKEPKAISAGKKAQIEGKVEKEFRGIADRIVAESPVGETYSQLKADTTFKDTASQAFRDVEALSDQVPGSVSTGVLKKNIVDRVLKKKGTGFTPSEYDAAHKKFIHQFLKNTPTQEITAKDLVTQYRKNNEALREAYEPGQSFAYNRAKREALQDYNRTIAEMIQEQYPGSEFAELFKSSNEQWSKIMDAEAIDKFIDGLFNGKIRFEKGRQLFDKAGMTVPFKRALGKEGFKQFEQLNKDLLSTEQANRMLKVAAKQGFGDKLSTLAAYVMHPKVGYAKMGFDLAKKSYKGIVEFLLDKPQFTMTWERGVKAFKKGDFKTAAQAFEVLEAEQAKTAKEATKATPKPKEPLTIEAKGERIHPKEENPLLLEGPKERPPAKEAAPEPKPAPEAPKPKATEAKPVEAKEPAKPKEALTSEESAAARREYRNAYNRIPKTGITENSVKRLSKKLDELVESGAITPHDASREKDYLDSLLRKAESTKPKEAAKQGGYDVKPEVASREYSENALKKMEKRREELQLAEADLETAAQRNNWEKEINKLDEQIADFREILGLPPEENELGKLAERFRKGQPKEAAPKEEPKPKKTKLEQKLQDILEKDESLTKKMKSAEDLGEKYRLVGEIEQLDKERQSVNRAIETQKFRKRVADLDKKAKSPKKTKLEALKEAAPKEKRPDVKAKVDEKIEKMERQDISKKGLKEQKQYLLNELDEAIKKAPEAPIDTSEVAKRKSFHQRLKEKEEYRKKSKEFPVLTFKVPGDGTFKIKNHKKALEAFRASVEKRWPDKPLKISKEELQQYTYKKTPTQKAHEAIAEKKEYEEYIKKYGTRG